MCIRDRNPGIYVELDVSEDYLTLLAVNIKPARIVSDHYAKSRPPERMDANMQKIRAKMQDLQITDAIKNGTMREEDMDTDAISYVSNQDTSIIARVKIAHFLLLGLIPNEATKHEADATTVAVKVKEDGVAAAVDTHEDEATAATAKLLRDLRNKNGVITEEGDANNNENGDAANASELLKLSLIHI